MNTVLPARRSLPIPVIIASVVVIALVAAAVFFFNHPSAKAVQESQASQEARRYVGHLQLSDVTMQATENFMNQQVVEVQGKIANTGPRALRSVDIYCLFQSIDGHEIRRERLPIVRTKGLPLHPGEVRAFRLPFDSVPEGWNQAVPRMVIADITFAQ